jgi:hypothetical protein
MKVITVHLYYKNEKKNYVLEILSLLFFLRSSKHLFQLLQGVSKAQNISELFVQATFRTQHKTVLVKICGAGVGILEQ